MSTLTKKIKKAIEPKEDEFENLKRDDFLSSSSTLLNLASTDRYYGGFIKGYYYLFVGDSWSGKTWIALACLAEASIDPSFDNYRLILDNVENGSLMNITKYFGKKVAERIEPPCVDKEGNPVYSSKVEEFYCNVDDACNDDRPFIYILDSLDSLSSEEESNKFEDDKKAIKEGKELKGSYGDGKAKKNSANLRRLMPILKKKKSILIVINQTRDNLGFGFEKKTRSGGNAPIFYSTMVMWTSIVEKITKTIKGKERQIGIVTQIHIKKNRVNGKERKIRVPIYHSYGIDDVGSCISYLIEEKHWSNKKGTIEAPEFEFTGTITKLIEKIEAENLQKKLKIVVSKVWKEIEDACALKRKPRYD